jgi:ABC-type multidrug transport system ATPase subunit
LKGLNVEQRKKLTIAVELVAKPELLLFLDEPSSGLDSQTSWSVIDLLEKLTRYGQAILYTIHQPSALLFQRFHRLLFLAPEGKPVYFGDIGPNSRIVIDYFERNGARPCPPTQIQLNGSWRQLAVHLEHIARLTGLRSGCKVPSMLEFIMNWK